MYVAHEARYETMQYKRCGRSGVMLPFLSLGLWHNFGEESSYANAREMVLGAFDRGITYFDIANNYGPPPGSAEECFGKIVKKDLAAYRDELFIATKAGYRHWPGPYGEWGSKKNLIASCDNSLRRLGLDYVDIFYHHRPDPDTPMEETMAALDQIVRSGKALYVGISNYNREQTREACRILREQGTPFIINQLSYSMLNRWIERDGVKDYLYENGIGCIAFSPLAQGILTGKYLGGIPADSRAGSGKSPFLRGSDLSEDTLEKVRALQEIARERGQSLTQMALAWILRDGKVASVLIGASRPEQIRENCRALDNISFSSEESDRIDEILR